MDLLARSSVFSFCQDNAWCVVLLYAKPHPDTSTVLTCWLLLWPCFWCRERGHGVPPHKDSSNTGPGPSSGQESASQASKSAPQSSSGDTSETTARDEFKQDRM